MKLNSIEELIEDIRAGKMVILMDDEDARERRRSDHGRRGLSG